MTTPASPSSDGQEIAPGVRLPDSELRFSTARSGGPGGQNVNKRSTKVELRVSLETLPVNSRVRRRLIRLAGSKLVGDLESGDAELLIVSEEHRTQLRNKKQCLERLRELIVEAQNIPKPRKKTRPSRGAIERRLREKREQGEKKQRRKPPE